MTKKKPKKKTAGRWSGRHASESAVLDGWLLIEEGAERIELKPDTLRRYCHRRIIPSQKVGSALLVHEKDLAYFQKTRRGRGRPSEKAGPGKPKRKKGGV